MKHLALTRILPMVITQVLCIVIGLFLNPLTSAGQSQIQLEIRKAPPSPDTSSCSNICQKALADRNAIATAISKQHITLAELDKSPSLPEIRGVNLAKDKIAAYLKPLKKKHMTTDEIDGLLMIWAAVAEYDRMQVVGGNNVALLTPHFKSLLRRIDYLLKPNSSNSVGQSGASITFTQTVTKEQLEQIQLALAMAEAETEGAGNDPTAK